MRVGSRLSPIVLGLAFAFGLIALVRSGPAEAATQSIVHTSIADFNRGTFYRTGMAQQSDGEVTLLSVGIAGEWLTTTNPAGFVPRSEHAAIATNNRLYVFGGQANLTTLGSVQYATINTVTHNLSNWVTLTAALDSLYPSGISSLSAVHLDGYVYLIGGYSSAESNITSTVAYAAIQGDGTLGAFAKTASLPQSLSRSEAVVLNGYVYVLGGRSPGGERNVVYYAQPNPSTGQIAAWFTATAALPYSVFGHQAFSADGRLYLAGGYTGGIVTNSVYLATPLTDTGNVAAGGWTATQGMPLNLYEAAGVSFGGQLYSTGGSENNLTTQSDYVGAAIPDENGQVVTWVQTSLIQPARFAHAVVVNDDGWIYLIGGTAGSNQPITTSIINGGATAGAGGSAYAASGRYTSPAIDLKRNTTLQQMKWTTYLGDTSTVSLTLRYRYRTATGTWSSWSPSLPSINAAGTQTTTYALSQAARYVQYEATLTSTNGLTTPILSRVEVQYDQPDPPLFIKSSSPASGSAVQSGTRITYVLSYSNTGGATFHNVVISDRVPVSTTYVAGSAFAPGGVTIDDGGNPYLVWTIGDLPPNAGGVVGYAVTVDGGLAEGAQIQNIADLTSDEVDTQSTAVVHTAGTPPRIGKSGVTSAPGQAGSTVQPGDLITYTLAYTNPNGSRALTGVVITDPLPAHLNYVTWIGSVAPDTSLLASQRTLRWFIGSLPANGSGSVGFVAWVANTAPNHAFIDNAAQMDSQESIVVTSGDHRVSVKYRFDLALSKSDDRLTAQAGNRITYTLRVTNTAAYAVTATGVIITDYLEPGLPGLTTTLLSYAGGTPGWAYVETDDGGNQVYAYAVGALGPNQSRAITMAVQIAGTLPAGVIAVRNSAEVADDRLSGIELDPSNQSASDTDVVGGADLKVTGLQVVSISDLRAVVVVTVTNYGVEAAKGPDGAGWFGTDLYVKPVGAPPPTGPGDRYLGACPTPTNYCPNDIRLSLYNGYTGVGLAPGETAVIGYTYDFPDAGTYWLYAQADPFWGQGGTLFGTFQNGRIVEADEGNNIYGPVLIDLGDYQVFLPALFRNR